MENNIEILSKHNSIFILKIQNDVVRLWHRDKLLNTITVPYNHCGCGLGECPLQHRNYPNNIKDFEFGKVISAVDFIWWNMWKKTKTANKNVSSYGLKHQIEKSLEYQKACKSNKVEQYNHLGNGELILAMQLLGFKIYPILRSQNVFFNIPNNCYLGHQA
jgi:hypothetical protein